MPRVFVIAGEASGDKLGAGLIRSLRARGVDEFIGIGGARMQAEGLASLFPMEELSLMGFAEILPHILHLKRRIRETVAAIRAAEPDVLVTIDSPGFNFRVVRELKKQGGKLPRLVHYVAPTVWAYKPERAAKTAALFDALMVILPFEPPWFEQEGLPTFFVGHPVVDEVAVRPEDRAAARAAWGVEEGDTLLCLLPGSRGGELKKLLPVYQSTVALLAEHISNLKIIMPVLPSFFPKWENVLKNAVPKWESAPILVTSDSDKKRAMQVSDMGLVKSGTVTLEAAMCGLPMLSAYKVNPLTATLVRRMINTPYVNLINILLEEPVVPELLQQQCTPSVLSAELLRWINSPELRQSQQARYQDALAMLKAPGNIPASDAAADRLLALI